MNDTLAYTIGEMYRLASDYAGDVRNVPVRSLRDIYDFVRRIPYVPDSTTGYPELLKRPLYGLQGGDCDDKTILAGALLSQAQIPWRIVTVAYDQGGNISHVYPEVLSGGTWRPFDATYPDNRLFRERVYTRRITWPNPMRITTQQGVTTLEGFPMGDTGVPIQNYPQWEQTAQAVGMAAVGQQFDVKKVATSQVTALTSTLAQTLIPIPVIGAVIGGALAYVASLIGVRGPTTHVDVDKVDSLTQEFKNSCLKFYDSLPADGQAQAYNYANAFLAVMVRDFGAQWGGQDLSAGDDPNEGFLNRNLRKARALGAFSVQRTAFANCLGMPYGTILRCADATTVKDNLNRWYFTERWVPVFANPLQSYCAKQLGAVLSYDAQSGLVTTTAAPQAATAGFEGLMPWILGGLAVGLLLSGAHTGKGARRRSSRGRRK